MFPKATMLLLAATAGLLAGCPLPPTPPTPVSVFSRTDPTTGRTYWMYVPSYYTADRQWPLVITLHGTYGWDGAWAQAMEWKYVAEQHGLIVVAPRLRSVQGILPVIRSWWYHDLAADQRAILAILKDVSAKYRIDPHAVLLTGFSAGGFPLYYVGMRNPKLFDMLIARACNSNIPMMEKIPITDALRKLPIVIFWGRDGLSEIRNDSWAAFRYLRIHKCYQAVAKQVRGGHLRRPDLAWRFWKPHLPKKYQQ